MEISISSNGLKGNWKEPLSYLDGAILPRFSIKKFIYLGVDSATT